MKEKNVKNNKERENQITIEDIISNEEYKKTLNEDGKSEYNYWWIVIFFIFAMYGLNEKNKNFYYKPERNEIINCVSNSDLSNADKKQIIDILLK